MYESFIVTNPRKRQYVSARHFGGNVKCHCRLQGWAARATGLLISDCSPQERARLGSFAGAWVGDPLMLAGPSTPILREIDFFDNVYNLALETYEPLGLRLVRMLAGNPAWAAELAHSLSETVLTYIAVYLDCAPFQALLKHKLGRRWRETFSELLDDRYGRLEREFVAYAEPQDLAALRELAHAMRGCFYEWVRDVLGAQPRRPELVYDGQARPLYVDHIRFVEPGTEAIGEVLVAHAHRTNSLTHREREALFRRVETGATEILVMVVLDDVPEDVEQAASRLGFYSPPGSAERYPRVQVLTGPDLLAGTQPAMPPRQPDERRPFRACGLTLVTEDRLADPAVPPPGPDGFLPLIVNPAKRQYLDPNRFPVGLERDWPLAGWPGRILSPLLGPYDAHWMGDPVILAGAEALPNPAGLETTTAARPHRNLFEQAWDEFEDLTLPLLTRQLVGDDDWLHEFMSAAWPNPAAMQQVAQLLTDWNPVLEIVQGAGEQGFVVLGHLAQRPDQTTLRAVLAQERGRDWEERYEIARWRHPEWRVAPDEADPPAESDP